MRKIKNNISPSLLESCPVRFGIYKLVWKILCLPHESYILIFMWICQQDSPAAVSEEELARHLHVKELDERPCMFQAGSAFDG